MTVDLLDTIQRIPIQDLTNYRRSLILHSRLDLNDLVNSMSRPDALGGLTKSIG